MRSEERIALVNGAHLTEDELTEACLLPGENRHLAVCGHCQARVDGLVRAFQQVRDDAALEADTVFTADRLQEQRDRIMRRIERRGHPAEVVRFPSPQSHIGMPRALTPVRRWVAAAAAAGLAAGMFLGFAMDRRTHYAAIDPARGPFAASAPMAAWTATQGNDDQFFSEIDDALMGSRTLELLALDAMTTPVEIREASYLR